MDQTAMMEKPMNREHRGRLQEGASRLHIARIIGFFIAYFALNISVTFVICYVTMWAIRTVAKGLCGYLLWIPCAILLWVGHVAGAYFGWFLHTIWFNASWDHFRQNVTGKSPIVVWFNRAILDGSLETWKKTLISIVVGAYVLSYQLTWSYLLFYINLAFPPCAVPGMGSLVSSGWTPWLEHLYSTR